MGNWQTVNVNGVIPADPIVSEGDGTTLIANTDLTNPIYLSDDPGMYAGQQYSIVLNPQSTMVVDGKTNLYAIANPGKIVAVNVVPGGMSFFQSTILGTNFLVTNAGFFFYSGPPAFGNLIADIVSPATTQDPFGNPAVPVFFAGDVNTAFTQIDASGDLIIHAGGNPVISISTTKLAMFFYTAAGIGLGNLVYSISLTGSGTDSAGNAYLPGATSYKKITSTDFQAYQTNSGGWNLWTATAPGGPWNLVFSTGLQADEVGYSLASNVNGNSITIGETADALQVFGGANIVNGGLAWAGGANGDFLHLNRSANGDGGLVLVQNTLANPGGNPTIFRAASTGDKVFAIDVAGDVSKRFRIDSDGEHNWGGGTSSPDAFLIYVSPGNLASSYISYTPSESAGVAEQWNAVTFANGWANAVSGTGMQYKRCAAPDNTVELVGRIVAPSGIAGNQTIFTLPTGYRPLSLQGVIGINITTGAVVRFTITNGGVFQYQSGAAAGNSIDIPAGSLVSLLA